MSYLVLARKWRPRCFAELVGQEHVVRALSHALDSGRVHHAFLFTGTRGVGKTTIARIFAKSLNCERGIGAEPCGECAVCTAVDAGRFVDLIEIDAASNTGVDDVREVIENAQYLPTRGRYKVYLVDEVHMLSRNAFNALLKTLEEPPEHVKFLLATTDPQKLPVTVLSRCLQFNLKRLTPEQISTQMRHILAAEAIAHDDRSLTLLARGADGSLRDGLSLLDQAIAYGAGSLRGEDVAQMLGSVDHGDVDGMLEALHGNDGAALLAAVDHLASFSPDYSSVLDTVAAALHRVQVRQLVPAAASSDDSATLQALAELPAEQIQLWYQMAISGRRELSQAPSPRIGFEMILLRMLAFAELGSAPPAEGPGKPVASGRAAAAAALASLTAPPTRQSAAAPAPVEASASAPRPVASAAITFEPRVVAPSLASAVDPNPAASTAAGDTLAGAPTAAAAVRPVEADSARSRVADNDDWMQRVAQSGLRGPALMLASHAQFLGDDGRVLRLGLSELQEHLRNPSLVEQLANGLAECLGGLPRIEFGKASAAVETLNERTRRQRDERQVAAEDAFAAEPLVQRLVADYGARIVPDSIRPLD